MKKQIEEIQRQIAEAEERMAEADTEYAQCECQEHSIDECPWFLQGKRIEAEIDSLNEQCELLVEKYREAAEKEWELVEDGYGYLTYFGTIGAALEEAVKNCEHQDPTRTEFHDLEVRCELTEERDRMTHVFQAEPPKCIHEDGHDWQAPYRIVGGIRQNPGVWGNGGGVVCNECCMHCGCRRRTDTWATNPADGTQGHTVVEYEVGYYSDQLAEYKVAS